MEALEMSNLNNINEFINNKPINNDFSNLTLQYNESKLDNLQLIEEINIESDLLLNVPYKFGKLDLKMKMKKNC